MLIDSESKVSGLGEVLLKKLVLLNLKSTLQNLKSLLSTYGNVNSDLFVTTDSEGTKGVSGLGVTRLLSSKLFQYTGSTGETITRLSYATIKDELVNLNVPHAVLLILGGHLDVFVLLSGSRGGDASWSKLITRLFYFQSKKQVKGKEMGVGGILDLDPG